MINDMTATSLYLLYSIIHWLIVILLVASIYLLYKVCRMDKPFLRATLFNRPQAFLDFINRFLIVIILLLVVNVAHLFLCTCDPICLTRLVCDPIWLLLTIVLFILFYRFWNRIKA